MTAAILTVSDDLENKVRTFLSENPEGGKFILPRLGCQFLAIPLMIAIFEDEGWIGSYDYDKESEWIEFDKSTPFLFGGED